MIKSKKRTIGFLSIIVLLCACLFVVSIVGNTRDKAYAESSSVDLTQTLNEITTPSVEIIAKNLALDDIVKMKFALSSNNVNNNDQIGVLTWKTYQESYTVDTAYNIITESYESMVVDGSIYPVYEVGEYATKMMTDTLYARAFAYRDGQYHYGQVKKYSILEYAYNKLGKTDEQPTDDQELIDVLNSMLDFGGKAQLYFNYKTDRLASDNYVFLKIDGAKFVDGFNYAFVKEGTTVSVDLSETADLSRFTLIEQATSTSPAKYSYTYDQTTVYFTISSIIHTESDWIIDTQATCTQTGSKHKECTECGEVIVTETIEKLEHNYVDYVCTECGDVRVNPKEELAKKLQPGYVAQFDDPLYAELVSFSAGTNSVEMTTFYGADVLKADISANAMEWVKMTISLPKAMTIGGQYKIRYYVVANGGAIPNVVRVNNVQGAIGSDLEYAPTGGTWEERMLTNLADGGAGYDAYKKNANEFNFQMINTESAVNFTIYVDYIYDITIANQEAVGPIVGKLQPGYVAQFDDPLYAELVSFSAGTYSVEMTTFDGADVLKADISANALEWVKMTISLPKTMTIGGQYKIRYYVVANGGALPNYFRLNNITGAMAGDLEYAPTGGVWEERMLTNLADGGAGYEAYKKNANEFNFQMINTGSALGFTIYVDYIYDCTLGPKDPLAEDLPEGYYAKFDNDAYLQSVSGSCASSSIVEFKGEKALKLSVTATNWADVKIALPKALEAGANYTVKYYLDWHYDTDGETKLATPNYFRFNQVVANTASDLELGGTAANYFGGDDWREINLTVHASHQETNLGTYTFQFIETNGAQYGFDLYVAYIKGENAHTHTPSDWIIDTQATCTQVGSKHKECTECGEVLAVETIAKLAHTESDWIIDTQATCTQTGSKHKECTECGEVIVTEAIEKLAHTESDWIIDTQATCTQTGSKHKECTECDEVIVTEVIVKLEHNYVDGLCTECGDGVLIVPEGYLATFTNATYVANAFDFAETQSTDVADYGVYPGSGVVVDYAGTENVGKYYFYTGSQFGYHTDIFVKLSLPQAYGADGYTIRYAFEYSTWAGNLMFTSGGAGSNDYLRLTGDTFPVAGEWMETYVNTNGATDNAIYMRIHQGAGGSQTITMYVAWVKDGDAREFTIELEDGYLAQYDSELYNNLDVTIPVRNNASSLGDQGVSSALVASYTDASDVTETDVLRLTVSGGHENTLHTNVIVKVDLPKAHTTAGYTIRWAMNCTSLQGADASTFIADGGTVRFITDEYVNNTSTWLDKFVIMNSDVYTQNTWATTYVGTLGTESNSLYIMIHRGAVQFGTFEFYISWVKEGDQVSAPEEPEPEQPLVPETGELASFNSDKYLDGITLPFAGTSNGVGQSLVSAEILESVELGGVTESTVLKVVVNSGQDVNGLGHVTAGVKIPLAEKYTAAGYTLRWAINFPRLADGNVRFIESAYANGGAWVDANNLYMQGNTLANDTWYTTYVGCTNESLSEIYMMAHGGYLGVQNITFYFAWVKEGDAIEDTVCTHVASDWIIDEEATCEVAGSKHKECTECGEVIVTETIAQLVHTESDWIIDTQATCTQTGSKHKECTECGGFIVTETIEKLEHNYVDGLCTECGDGVLIVPEGYLATFTNATYVANAFSFAETQSDSVDGYGIYPGSGVVVDYAGTENVAKYYFYTGSQYGYHTDIFVKLSLPQAYGADGYTIRYAFEYSTWAGNLMFTSGGAGSNDYLRLTGDTFPVAGEWMETYVNTNGATDNAIYMRIHQGAGGSQTITMYVAWVKDGNTIELIPEEDKYTISFDLTSVVRGMDVECELVDGNDINVNSNEELENHTLHVVKGQTLRDIGIESLPEIAPIDTDEYSYRGYWKMYDSVNNISYEIDVDTVISEENFPGISESRTLVLIPACSANWTKPY